VFEETEQRFGYLVIAFVLAYLTAEGLGFEGGGCGVERLIVDVLDFLGQQRVGLVAAVESRAHVVLGVVALALEIKHYRFMSPLEPQELLRAHTPGILTEVTIYPVAAKRQRLSLHVEEEVHVVTIVVFVHLVAFMRRADGTGAFGVLQAHSVPVSFFDRDAAVNVEPAHSYFVKYSADTVFGQRIFAYRDKTARGIGGGFGEVARETFQLSAVLTRETADYGAVGQLRGYFELIGEQLALVADELSSELDGLFAVSGGVGFGLAALGEEAYVAAGVNARVDESGKGEVEVGLEAVEEFREPGERLLERLDYARGDGFLLSAVHNELVGAENQVPADLEDALVVGSAVAVGVKEVVQVFHVYEPVHWRQLAKRTVEDKPPAVELAAKHVRVVLGDRVLNRIDKKLLQ
jgi:hypothetical protein